MTLSVNAILARLYNATGLFLSCCIKLKEVTMILIAGILSGCLLSVIFEWRKIKNKKATVENERVIHPAEFPMR